MNQSTEQQANAIKQAIDGFLANFDRDPKDEIEGLRRLAVSLDNLVAVYFKTADVEPDSEAEAPEKRYQGDYAAAAKAFPELGLYPWIDVGGDPGEEEAGVADAIDDLADIAGDLQDVLWHFKNATIADGIWEFRFGYQSHWGVHLHRLRAYLHSTKVAAW